MPQFLITLLVAVALLAGCGERSVEPAATAQSEAESATAPNSAPAHQAAAPTPAPADSASVPDAVNPTTGVAPTGASWNAYLDTLAPGQKKDLAAFNSRHFGALSFQDEAERRKLEELGIPTAEDVLEAAKLTDGELKTRADAGDVQAQMLLIDRLTAQAEAMAAAGDTQSDAYKATSARAFVEMTMLSARHKQSPFGPYLQGRLNWKLRSGQPAEVMAASLMVAADLGDWRAKSWLAQFQRENPQLDAARTVTIYNQLRTSWQVQ